MTLITDDFLKISLIINNNIMTASCSLAKPCIASEGLKTPPITKTRSAIKKDTVGLNHSKYKAESRKTITARMMIMEGVSI